MIFGIFVSFRTENVNLQIQVQGFSVINGGYEQDNWLPPVVKFELIERFRKEFFTCLIETFIHSKTYWCYSLPYFVFCYTHLQNISQIMLFFNPLLSIRFSSNCAATHISHYRFYEFHRSPGQVKIDNKKSTQATVYVFVLLCYCSVLSADLPEFLSLYRTWLL